MNQLSVTPSLPPTIPFTCPPVHLRTKENHWKIISYSYSVCMHRLEHFEPNYTNILKIVITSGGINAYTSLNFEVLIKEDEWKTDLHYSLMSLWISGNTLRTKQCNFLFWMFIYNIPRDGLIYFSAYSDDTLIWSSFLTQITTWQKRD